MKRIFLVAFSLITLSSMGQELNFNKWSLDIGAGVHDIAHSLSPGYTIDRPALWQANVGIRKMFNENFGLRLGFGMNKIEGNATSQPFEATFTRFTLEGVVNAGNFLNFQNWTKKLNLLLHSGIGFGSIDNALPFNATADTNMHFMVGFTPQYRLSDRLSLFFDYSLLFNYFQNRTFNNQNVSGFRHVNSTIFNTSLGVSFAIGKYKRHADFWREKTDSNVAGELNDIKMRLEKAEDKITVLENTKPIVSKEVIVKELDKRYVKKDELTLKQGEVITASNVDFIKELLNRGYVNVYFDTNKDEVQKGSMGAINYLKQFMLDNPSRTAVLVGYADETGDVNRNQSLSERRAKKVFDILVAAGISANRLTYSGGGVDASVTEGARQLARKVRFLIN